MDKLNQRWLNNKQNFYFRYKHKVIESLIEGTCLNVGCGGHRIADATNVDLPEVNAINLPYRKNNFDTVILADVLEHLYILERNKALEEAIRVANKKVIITLPAFQCLWSDYDEKLGHWKRFRKYEWCLIANKTKQYYLFGALFPIFYLRKFTSGKTPNLPKWLDTIFYWLSHIRLPFGSTLVMEIYK
jgi:hypothetical protein